MDRHYLPDSYLGLGLQKVHVSSVVLFLNTVYLFPHALTSSAHHIACDPAVIVTIARSLWHIFDVDMIKTIRKLATIWILISETDRPQRFIGTVRP